MSFFVDSVIMFTSQVSLIFFSILVFNLSSSSFEAIWFVLLYVTIYNMSHIEKLEECMK